MMGISYSINVSITLYLDMVRRKSASFYWNSFNFDVIEANLLTLPFLDSLKTFCLVHRYTSTIRDIVGKRNTENNVVRFLKNLSANRGVKYLVNSKS